MAASVRRISAVAEAYCSQQPLRPQGQGSPPAWSTMCPASLEDSPPRRRPSRMIPAPRPVPRVSTTKSRRPRPAPWKYSPTAAQSASLPSSTGRSSRRRNRAARSVRSRGMLVVYRTSPPETAPGRPMPTPSASPGTAPAVESTSAARSARSAAKVSAPRKSRGRRAAARRRPVSSVRPAFRLVPPTSIPMKNPLISVSGCPAPPAGPPAGPAPGRR